MPAVAPSRRPRLKAALELVRSVDDLTPPRSPRYRTLDHWRGIACLMVVVFHTTSVWAVASPASGSSSGGAAEQLSTLVLDASRLLWLGVPFFFVISGYAISATADSSRRKEHGARGYAWRRFRRIYPPYWAMLAVQAGLIVALDVVLVPNLLTGSPAPIQRPWLLSAPQWLGNLTLTESWRYHLLAADQARQYVLGQAWTLCYEEQFYLVMGVLILAIPRRLFAGAAIVTAVVLLAQVAASRLHVHLTGLFLDGYWLNFAAGVLVYRQVNFGSRKTLVGTWLLLGLGAAYALRAGVPMNERNEFLLSGFLFAGLVLALHPLDGRLSSARLLAPIRFLGTICYSMYLSHAIVVRAISTVFWNAGVTSSLLTLAVVIPLSVAAAILVATAFHRLVERRFVSPSAGSGFVAPVVGPAAAPAAAP